MGCISIFYCYAVQRLRRRKQGWYYFLPIFIPYGNKKELMRGKSVMGNILITIHLFMKNKHTPLAEKQLGVMLKPICMTRYCVGCRIALIPPDLHCIEWGQHKNQVCYTISALRRSVGADCAVAKQRPWRRCHYRRCGQCRATRSNHRRGAM